jgi:hypothetical protein
MGFPWENNQQDGSSNDSSANIPSSLEERVAQLELQVQRIENQLTIVVRNLEEKLGDDLNNDGTIPV